MTQEHHSDRELIFAIQNGAHEAFSSLVKRYSAKFYSIAYRLTNSKEQAEDIVQDCFIKFWTKPHSFDLKKDVKFSTWFYKVISNAAFDLKRKYSKQNELPEDLKDQSEDIASILDKEKFQATLWNFINSLPERQQLALNLCFYEDISNKEAAQIMEINLKALESLLMRAKNKLKEKFKDLEKTKDYQNAI